MNPSDKKSKSTEVKGDAKPGIPEKIGFRVQLTFPDLLVKEENSAQSPDNSRSGTPLFKRLGGVFKKFGS